MVRRLAEIQCTAEEIAFALAVPLDDLKALPEFSSTLEAGAMTGKRSIRRQQFRLAMDGNVQMLIYLGRVLLAQDVKEETGPQYPFAKRPADVDRLKTDVARRLRPE